MANPPLALAAEPGASGIAPVLDVRRAAGVDEVAHLGLWLLGAGVGWRLAPTLELQALALALATEGEVATGRPAAGGGGGEVGLRVVPWTATWVRLVAEARLGLMLFPGRPFLPGADVYEGIVSFGAGSDVVPVAGWTLGARAFLVHLSNGQGLGPHNPAYDGWGAALSLTRASWPDAGATQDEAVTDARVGEPAFVGIVSGELGEGDGELLAGNRVRLAHRLAPVALATLEAAGGAFAGFGYGEVGAALVGQTRFASLGAFAGYRRFAGVDIAVATSQLEWFITREASLVAMGHHERSNGFDRVWRAAVGARVFPWPRLAIDLGVGFDRLGDGTVFANDHSDPYLGLEWLCWTSDRGLGASLFIERQVSTLSLAGLRLAYGASRDLRERDRHDSWRPVR